ncbi:putative GTP-binding protein YjiA [compost metagenome]
MAQTFFVDETLRERYLLDGIITLVDAVNAERHLQETIAQAQAGFGDRILVSKRDLVAPADYAALVERLQRINRRAEVFPVDNGAIDLDRLLDVRGFNLNAEVGLRPLQPLRPAATVSDRIATLVLRTDRPLDIERLSQFMDDLLQWHGNSLLRYKGVLNIAGEARRLVFQGVLRLYGFDWDTEWQDGEVRESVMVFIGDNLPEEQIRQGFEAITGA